MAEPVYRQMPAPRELSQQIPAPRELSQQIPAPRAKARMQKPQGGGKFLVQILGGGGAGGDGYGWNWYLHYLKEPTKQRVSFKFINYAVCIAFVSVKILEPIINMSVLIEPRPAQGKA